MRTLQFMTSPYGVGWTSPRIRLLFDEICQWYTGSGHVEPPTYPVPEVIKVSIPAWTQLRMPSATRTGTRTGTQRHSIALRTTACWLPLGEKNGKAFRRKNSLYFVYPSVSSAAECMPHLVPSTIVRKTCSTPKKQLWMVMQWVNTWCKFNAVQTSCSKVWYSGGYLGPYTYLLHASLSKYFVGWTAVFSSCVRFVVCTKVTW